MLLNRCDELLALNADERIVGHNVGFNWFYQLRHSTIRSGVVSACVTHNRVEPRIKILNVWIPVTAAPRFQHRSLYQVGSVIVIAGEDVGDAVRSVVLLW